MADRPPIRAIIFDFGSVLVLMGDETPRQALAEQFGVPLKELYKLVFDSQTAIDAMVGGLTIQQHWQAIGEALGVKPEDLQEVIKKFWSVDVVNDELVDLIHKLRGRYKIGLLSNAWDDLRQVLATRITIAHLFDDIVVSAEVGMGKPDPRIYQLAVQRLDVGPSEAVFIDDVPANVAAARETGLNAIHFQNNAQLFAELRAYNISV